VRSRRFKLLDGLQRGTSDASVLPRLSHCRRDPHGMAEFVGIVAGQQGSAYTGLQTCGSVWACPIDSAKVRHDRALRLSRCVVNWADAGGGLVFPTMTLAHVSGDSLAKTFGHLLAGWRFVVSSRAYKRLKKRLGIEHVCRAVEITHGFNGWHPHLHLLFFTIRPLTRAELLDVWAVLLGVWQTYVELNDLRPIDSRRGVYVKAVNLDSEKGLETLGEYLSKTQDGYGIAAELVRGDLKKGRSKKARSPFALAEAAIAGDARALALWREYEVVTKGRHALELSPASKTALGWGEDLPDDQVAASEDGGLIWDLTPAEWALVVRYRRRGYLLNVADLSGREGVQGAVSALRRRERHDGRKVAR
jgi:hypothetical protein